MAARSVAGLTLAGALFSVATGSFSLHVDTPPDQAQAQEAQLAFELTGEAYVNRTGAVQRLPRMNVKDVNVRPVVVFKMDRTGSSWFATQLNQVGAWPKVKAEATNNHEWCRKTAYPSISKCMKLVKDTVKFLKPNYGGMTLNPYKFDCTRPGNGTCFNSLWNTFKLLKPFAIALVRKNVVLQAASHLRSKAIEDMGLCNHGFHLSNCDDAAQSYRATVAPATLLKVARKNQKIGQQLRVMASRVAAPEAGTLTLMTEEFFDSATRTFTVPDKVWSYLGLDTSSPLWNKPQGSPLEDGDSGVQDNSSLLMDPSDPDSMHSASSKGDASPDDMLEDFLDMDTEMEIESIDDAYEPPVSMLVRSDSVKTSGDMAAAGIPMGGLKASGIAARFRSALGRTFATSGNATSGGKELLRNYITNYEEVQAYFKENAADLFEFVLAEVDAM